MATIEKIPGEARFTYAPCTPGHMECPINCKTSVSDHNGRPSHRVKNNQYEVFAPTGFVFEGHGCHSFLAVDKAEAREYAGIPVEKCTDTECDICCPEEI